MIDRLRFKATASTRFVLGAPRRIGRAAGRARASRGLQSANDRLGPDLPRRAGAARRQRAAARGGAAAAHPQPGLQLHAGAGRLRPQRRRRVLARSQGRLLRALRGRIRRRHARARHPGADRHRLPGHRPAADRRLLRRSPELGARLGRVLAERRRLDPRRPDRRGRARPHQPQQPARAAAGLRRRHARRDEPAAVRAPAQQLGGDQQPLEPVDPQLLARPAVRRAQAARLRARRPGKTWRCSWSVR